MQNASIAHEDEEDEDARKFKKKIRCITFSSLATRVSVGGAG